MTPFAAVRGLLDRRRTVRTVGWVVLGVGVVLAVRSTVAPEEVLRTLAGADQRAVAVAAGLLLAAILARGLVLWVTLRAVGAPVGVARGLGTYLVVGFVNTVVPGGGAGGAPVTGMVVARSARTTYETGVTATVTVSTLSNLMVGVFGVVGLFILALTGGPADLLLLGWIGVGVFLAGIVVAVVGWRFRARVGDAVVSGVASALAVLDRRLPWTLPDRETVEARAATVGDALNGLVDGPATQTAALLGLSATAHLLSISALFLAFASLDIFVSVGVLLAAVPTAVLAAVTPAPGAAGGVEVALGALLVTATGHPVAAVGAAVLIYRGSGYAFRLVLGGIAGVVLALLS